MGIFLKKNPAGLEELKKISSSLKTLQTADQKSNGPPLKVSSSCRNVYEMHMNVVPRSTMNTNGEV